MASALVIAPPLILAAVLAAGAIAKLRLPDDLAGWSDLGVPAAFRRQWLVRFHPWGELVLAVSLVVLGGILGLAAAIVAVALMAAYLSLVARLWSRARSSSQDASCACFGARRTVTGVTVARNVWLVVLSVAAALGVWTTPLLGGVLASIGDGWGWVAAGAAAAVTVALVLWPDQPSDSPAPMAETRVDDEGDYLRRRTPSVPVTLADGSLVNLRELASTRPLLLLAVSSTCGTCVPVIERMPQYRLLIPEIDIRFIVRLGPEESPLIERDEPQSIHDKPGYVRGSIEEWSTPTALLLGADGMLAGGPVTGVSAIEEFVQDVRSSLDEMIGSA